MTNSEFIDALMAEVMDRSIQELPDLSAELEDKEFELSDTGFAALVEVAQNFETPFYIGTEKL